MLAISLRRSAQGSPYNFSCPYLVRATLFGNVMHSVSGDLLPQVLLSLLLHLKWNQTAVISDNREVGSNVLRVLHESGILTASVDASGALRYPWPRRNGLEANFDGYILLIESTSSITSLVPRLKVNPIDIVVPRFSWIFASSRELCLPCIESVLTEGDKVAVVTKSSREDPALSFDILSLYSVGDGSVELRVKGNWAQQNGLQLSSSSLYFPPFRNFQQRELRVSALGSPPIKEPPLKNEKKWRGYMFRIINTLGDLLNFTYTVKEADDRLYGIAQEDGTWSGMIGELIRKEVDVGVGDLSWSPDRSTVVDFTEAVFPETVTFIYKAPGFYSRAWILFENINYKIWISFLLCTTIIGLMFFFTLIHEQMVYRKEVDVKCVGAVTLSFLFRVFVGQGATKLPEALSSRTLLGTWLLGCLVFTALYSGTLTSRLSMHQSPRPAESISQLMKRYPKAELAVRNNSLPHAYFKESPVNKDLWATNIRNHVISGKTRIRDILARVKNSSVQYVWIGERSMLEKKMREESEDKYICDLYVAREELVRSDWALALTLDSPFLQQFNEKIIRMRNFGLVERWRTIHWTLKNATCRPSDGLNQLGRTPISTTDTESVFLILLFGYAGGFLILTGELLYNVEWSQLRCSIMAKRRIKPHSC